MKIFAHKNVKSVTYSLLFVSLLDDEAQEDLRANKNLSVYKGALI